MTSKIPLSMLAAIALLVAAPAHSCLPNENYDIYFAKDSAYISNAEIIRLANWIVDQKIRYPKITANDVTMIYGVADRRERNAKALATARMKAGIEIFTRLGFMRGTIIEGFHVYKVDFDNFQRIEIQLSPGSPDKCLGIDPPS